MEDKYNIHFDSKVVEKYINRLTNQIWKLIPMKENNEDWRNQIDKDLIELAGLHEIFQFDDRYLNISINLEGLKCVEVDFDVYRGKVFESITLLRECFKNAKKQD